MNKFIITLSALVVVATPASLVTADNLGNEVMPMLYIKVPIDGNSTSQRETVYGAALSIVETSRSTAEKGKIANFMNTDRPRLLDLRFKQGSVDSLKMNGMSLMQKVVTVNADGSTSEEMSSSDLTPGQWAIIVLGVGAALCVGDVICDNDDDDDASRQADDMMGPDDLMADNIQ